MLQGMRKCSFNNEQGVSGKLEFNKPITPCEKLMIILKIKFK